MHPATLTLLVGLAASALLLFFDWRLHVQASRERAARRAAFAKHDDEIGRRRLWSLSTVLLAITAGATAFAWLLS